MMEALEGHFATGPGAPPPRREPWQDAREVGDPHGKDLRELLLGSSFHFMAGKVSGLGAMTGWGKALTGSSSASPGGGLTSHKGLWYRRPRICRTRIVRHQQPLSRVRDVRT